MIPISILIHIISLIGLLYISFVMIISKKTALKALFFTINKTYNICMCLYVTANITDFSLISGYLPCPNVHVFTLFKFLLNTVLTAFSVAQFEMVLIRYKIVINSRTFITNRRAHKYLLSIWVIAILNAFPLLWVNWRYEEKMKYYVYDVTSIPYLIFDILEGLSSSICFLLSVHFTFRIFLFMRKHKKRYDLYVLHAFLSTLVPIALITFQWLRVAWRAQVCQICAQYADYVRYIAGPITLIVAFSIVVCSTEVRREVFKPFRILFCRSKTPIIRVVFSGFTTDITGTVVQVTH